MTWQILAVRGPSVVRRLAASLAAAITVAVLTALAVQQPAAALSSEDRARSFIEGMAAEAIDALTTAKAPQSEKVERFRVLLQDKFAVNDIGEWVLGRYWERATPEERAEYLALFEEMIVTTYVRRFEQYAGETLAVSRAFSSSEGGDVLVDSQIVRPGAGEPVNVGWRVRAYDEELKIVDVIIEGVSMGLTQRSEFGSVIRRSGGNVAGLLDEMRRMVEDSR